MSYYDKEAEIFDRWIKRSKDSNHGGREFFAPDGLCFRGQINYSDAGYWYRGAGKEEQQWDNAQYKVMLITKDINGSKPWDIREETGRTNHSGEDNVKITARFYQNYMLWVYGILNTLKSGSTPDFEEINTGEILYKFYDSVPLVRLNCKKQIGENTISNLTLNSYIETYKDLLLEQISLYDANIIICGGGSSSIKDFVCDNYLNGYERINSWVYYSKESEKVVIDSYHPSYYGLSQYEIYRRMMEAFGEFMLKYPEFKTRQTSM